MWILQCWLLLSSTGDKKRTEAGAGEGMDVWRAEKSEASEWKRSWKVRWKETCRRRNGKLMGFFFFHFSFHIWKKSMPQFCGFWRILLSVCCQALVFWCGQVWTGVFEGDWMFVFRLVGWTRGRKSKRGENEPEKSCSIVDKRVLRAAGSHRLTIHLVHCVFSKKKKKKCTEMLWNQKCLTGDWCPFYTVRSLQVVVWRKESDIVRTTDGVMVAVHTASQK